MAGPIRPDEYGALETLHRGPVKRDRDGSDTRFDSLVKRGMAEDKRGTISLTTRGKTTLQRRTGVRRGSR
jgi:hypothetical protein